MADPFAPNVFAKVLVRYVPQATIHTAVDAILPPEITGLERKDFISKLRPEALNDLPSLMEALTNDLIARNLLMTFARTLMRSMPNDTRINGILSREIAIDGDGTMNEGQLQSLRNRRQPFVNSKTFGDFMVSVRNQVCAIWVRGTNSAGAIRGTGFLIAPDLLLTARHVVCEAIEKVLEANPDPNAQIAMKDKEKPGTAIKCVFDYWMPIAPQAVEAPQSSGITVVDAAAEWLVWSSQGHPVDGISHQFPLPPDVGESLDCAVLRLARPIGAEAFESGGGRMRGWVKLPAAATAVGSGDAIAILQHPAGGPQGMDKGSFFDIDGSHTRLWYTTEAAAGSSGSPCFDAEATIVGFHNAGRPTSFWGPTADCNQGISIEPVVRALPTDVVARSQNGLLGESALWSLSDDPDKPVPVLGRAEFKAAALAQFDPRSEKRMIVVDEAKDVEAIGKSGKSFSAGILKAIARDRPSIILEFSALDLKATAPEDFLNVVGRRIGIDPEQLAKPPQKPQEERQITRWWSNDLPDWFGSLVEERAIRAGSVVHDVTTPGPTSAATGRSQVINELIWFIIDDIHKAPPNAGMKELLAGLTGVTDTQPALRAGLRALRWLVIGHVPDFVRERSIQHVPDTVSQTTIGEKEWVDCVRTYFLSSGDPDRYNEATATALYGYSLDQLQGWSDPACKLSVIASAIPTAIRHLRRRR
jgi:hypothetical protein